MKDELHSIASAAPLLSVEEELQLADRIQKGIKVRKLKRNQNPLSGMTPDAVQAAHQMVLGNLRLAISLSKRFKTKLFSMDDAIQEAILGLYYAARHYNPKKFKTKFSTYATFWCCQKLHKGQKLSGLIHVPIYVRQLVKKKLKGQKLSEKQQSKVSDFRRAIKIGNFPLDFELEVEQKDSFAELMEREALEKLYNLMRVLPKRHLLTVKLKLGFVKDGKSRTFSEIAETLGVSKQRACQIYHDAIETLKDGLSK